MAGKNTAVGKGDMAEQAYDRVKKRAGFHCIAKSTRSMIKINGRFVQTIVDLFNSFDRVYVKNDTIEFAQITTIKNLKSHKENIEKNFNVIFTIPNVRIVIPLWYKEIHGKSERYMFKYVEWKYCERTGKMRWSDERE